ncbi:hypothetical protein JTE90_000556 [Oedothorax gibbosus]|uniref:BRICHOS domain-containing protein n=1 Tax=Oedothorax gibbosus TaxID=931172 RepID=A0AAV6VXJ1_9ARAC|nr:hypothetical protein JTE90_000556 [Oedothorax gibbosus]
MTFLYHLITSSQFTLEHHQGFCTIFCDAKSIPVPSKEVYVLRYFEDKKIVPIAVEIDLKHQTELLFSLGPDKRRVPVTFYDFSQRKVAYRDYDHRQCFIGDIGRETLEGDRRRLTHLKNGIVKGFYIPTLIIHREIKNKSEVLEQFGNTINSFCNESSVFYVTSHAQLSRKRRDTTSSGTDGNGQFTHHSYGHYGHQTNNYAHYGHETYMTGTVDKGGVVRDGQIRQHQVRTQGSQSYPSEPRGSSVQAPPSNGQLSSRNVPNINIPFQNTLPSRNLGATGSGQFSLQTAQDSGYQLNLPLGITSGSSYRGGVRSQGQYGVGGMHPQIHADSRHIAIPGTETALHRPSSTLQTGHSSIDARRQQQDISHTGHSSDGRDRDGFISPDQSQVVGGHRTDGLKVPDHLRSIDTATGGRREGGIITAGPRQTGFTTSSDRRGGFSPMDVSQTPDTRIIDRGRDQFLSFDRSLPIDYEHNRYRNAYRGLTTTGHGTRGDQRRDSLSSLGPSQTFEDRSIRAMGTPGISQIKHQTAESQRRDGGVSHIITPQAKLSGLSQNRHTTADHAIDSPATSGISQSRRPTYPETGTAGAVPYIRPSTTSDVDRNGFVLPSSNQTVVDQSRNDFSGPHAIDGYQRRYGYATPGVARTDTLADDRRRDGFVLPDSSQTVYPTSVDQPRNEFRLPGFSHTGQPVSIDRSQFVPAVFSQRGDSQYGDSRRDVLHYPTVSESTQTADDFRRDGPFYAGYPITPPREIKTGSTLPGALQSGYPVSTDVEHSRSGILSPGILQSRGGDTGLTTFQVPGGLELPRPENLQYLPGQSRPVSSQARMGDSVRYSGADSAISQTQIQTNVEGTAAEASSAGQLRGHGSQTQVIGSHTGNGSFSAEAQSGFTGGAVQSQVLGNSLGGMSGSSALVEQVGSAQSQVQIGQPSGSASSSAQGRFSSGMTQVRTQTGTTGGSAGAESQSSGLSSSQVQVNINGEGGRPRTGFNGKVSAFVRGGQSSGQSQTQLQGGYDSGRTYSATAQGGFDSTLGFKASGPTLGSVPSTVSPMGRSSSVIRPTTRVATHTGQLQRPGENSAQQIVPGSADKPQVPTDETSGIPRSPYILPLRQSLQQSRIPTHANGISQPSVSEPVVYRSGYQLNQRQPLPQIPAELPSYIPGGSQIQQPRYQPSNIDTQSRVQTGFPSFVSESSQISSLRPGMQQHQPSHTRFPSPVSLSFPGQQIFPEVPKPLALQPAYYEQPSTYISPPRPDHRQDVPRSPDVGIPPGHYQQPATHIPSPIPSLPQVVPRSPDRVIEPGHYQQPATRTASPRRDRPQHVPKSPDLFLQPGHYQQPATHIFPPIPGSPQDVPKSPDVGIQPEHYQQPSLHISPPRPGYPQDVPKTPGDLDIQPRHFELPATHIPDRSQVVPKPPNVGIQPGHYQQPSVHISPPRPDHPQDVPKSPGDLGIQSGHFQQPATHIPDRLSTSVISRLSESGSSGQQRPGPREPDQGSCCDALRSLKRRCCGGSGKPSSSCCSGTSQFEDDFALDFDDGSDKSSGAEPCKVVKAICYIVYKPVGKARICKPTSTTASRC